MKARRKNEGAEDTEQGVRRINISLTPATHEIDKCLAKKRYGQKKNTFSPLVEELIVREARRHKIAA